MQKSPAEAGLFCVWVEASDMGSTKRTRLLEVHNTQNPDRRNENIQPGDEDLLPFAGDRRLRTKSRAGRSYWKVIRIASRMIAT